MSFNLLNIGELANPRGGQGHEAPPRPIFFSFSCSFQEQLTKTRMHSSRMRTARSSSRLGGLHQASSREQASPQNQTPREQAPPPTIPPRTRHPRDQAPPQPHPSPPWIDTHLCKHITLPQTSFAGGNNRLAPLWETLDPPLLGLEYV